MARELEEAVRINEDIRVQEIKSCLLCSGEGKILYQRLRDRLFRAPGIWAFRQCSECGLIWLDPRPVPADTWKLYEYYFTQDTGSCLARVGLPTMVSNAVLAARLGYNGLVSSPLQKGLGTILSWIGPIRDMVELSVMGLGGPPKGKLLDVGCGNGRFLAEMRELGWEVAGVEPDGQAVEVARERFGLDVHEGTLEKGDFPNDSFHAITMNHVIEHLLDPIGTLQQCRRVLKPGGKLIVITPNVGSLGHWVFRALFFHLDPPRHFYLFSVGALQTCAERARLEVVKLRTAARSARQVWARSCLIRRKKSLRTESPFFAKKGFRCGWKAWHFRQWKEGYAG